MSLLKRSFKLLLSVLLLNSMLSTAAETPSGTSVVLGNKHYYIETTQPANFYEAAHACAQYDMTLVSFENKAEYDRVYTILKTSDNLKKQFWLSGSSYGNSDNTFSWLGTGKPVTYWSDTEITAATSCLKTDVTSFQYAASDCSASLYYICEKPLEPNCGKFGQCRYTYSYNSK